MRLLVVLLFLSSGVHAQIKSGYLTEEEQKYYKNDSFDGNNQRERIDSLVRETNKLHQMVAGLKAEVQTLRKEIDELKKSK